MRTQPLHTPAAQPTPGIGDAAPDFSLPDHTGAPRSLADLLARPPLVLFFYPGDFTPGCTIEACAFRDAFQDFTDAGATVAGISADPPDTHSRFAGRHRLPFSLLSDTDNAVRRRYGIAPTLGLLPGRATFVIDSQRTIRHRFTSQFMPRRHIREALRVVRALGLSAPPSAPPLTPPR